MPVANLPELPEIVAYGWHGAHRGADNCLGNKRRNLIGAMLFDGILQRLRGDGIDAGGAPCRDSR